MIDLHSHLIPNIDDGSNSIEETILLIEKAKSVGITNIVLTPHYYCDTKFNANNKKKKKAFDEVVKSTIDLGVTLHLGNEVHFNEKLISLKDEYLPIAETDYLLLELPRDNFPKNIITYIHELQLNHYKIIIAHPERYRYFQEDINLLIPLLDKGILMQSNIGSLFDDYGVKARKALKLMIKHNMIQFLASDSHRINDGRYDFYKNLNKKLKLNQIKELTVVNPKLVLENKKVSVKKYKKCNYTFKKILNKYKIN